MRLFVRHLAVLTCSLIAINLTACAGPAAIGQRPMRTVSSADFTVADRELRSPPAFVIYGDMRFTSAAETVASQPGPRHAILEKVAAEQPDGLFLTGDIPWHGGARDDYRVFREETALWGEQHIRVYPVLGNHEFQQCTEAECLENWWSTFPQLRGRRWYSVDLGTSLRALALDSNASLLPDSAQRAWLERQVEAVPRSVRFLVILLHHPPLEDDPPGVQVRPNEQALETYLSSVAQHSRARFLVCAAHVHNYERFEQDGVVYLVSGGGGAKPSVVTRTDTDQYKDLEFPNFHYLRFKLQGSRLVGEMVRLGDPDAPSPGSWVVKDRFELTAAVGAEPDRVSHSRRQAE
jgi:acid phosphatase type 7